MLSNSAFVCLPDVAGRQPTAKWASRHIRFLNGNEVHLSVQGPLSLPYRDPARASGQARENTRRLAS